VFFGLAFALVAYTTLSALTITYFGIANVAPSVFENFQTDNSVSSYVLRAIFLTIFLCNIPFVFFPGKQAVLAIIALCKNKIVDEEGNTP